MARVYYFCIVTSHLFRYKMEKSWKILQFGDISTKDHSAVGAALLLMRLPSLLIKPIASCRSLTRFVKIITFALDSCIFGGSFRKSMYRYPCFGIHGYFMLTCNLYLLTIPESTYKIYNGTNPTIILKRVIYFMEIKSEHVFLHL